MEAVPVDLFPYTDQCELVMRFEREKITRAETSVTKQDSTAVEESNNGKLSPAESPTLDEL